MADWSRLTNHGRLLLTIENEPGLRVRDMADRLRLSESGVGLILRDSREAPPGGSATASYLRSPLRTYLVRHQTVGQLLQLPAEAESPRPRRARRQPPGKG